MRAIDCRKDAHLMSHRSKNVRAFVFAFAFFTTSVESTPLSAQESKPADSGAPPNSEARVRITLEEAKQRALANSKLLNLATLNVESKDFAIRAAKADYFPKITGSVFYFHFNDDLGTVITGGGRTVRGPKGRPLITFPSF